MSGIDATAIHDSLNSDVASKLEQLEVFAEIDSTNSYLLQQPAPAAGSHRVAVADHQTAGRGRQGREWVSAPGSSLCLSLAYSFTGRPGNLPGLTLAIGVAALNALQSTGIDDVQLKWPNDLVARDGKLGGMLAETQYRGDSAVTVVAGVGINIDLPAGLLEEHASGWAQRSIDLKVLRPDPPTREALAGALVNHLVESMDLFAKHGLDAFIPAWRRNDWLSGRQIVVESAEQTVGGRASGIDADGALLLESGGVTTRVISGSVILGEEVSP